VDHAVSCEYAMSVKYNYETADVETRTVVISNFIVNFYVYSNSSDAESLKILDFQCNVMLNRIYCMKYFPSPMSAIVSGVK